MTKKNPVGERRKDEDPDHAGDPPVLPMPPDEMVEFEEQIVQGEDDERDDGTKGDER